MSRHRTSCGERRRRRMRPGDVGFAVALLLSVTWLTFWVWVRFFV